MYLDATMSIEYGVISALPYSMRLCVLLVSLSSQQQSS